MKVKQNKFFTHLFIYAILCFALLVVNLHTLPLHANSGLKLTPEQQSWLKNHPIIKVCPDPFYAPIETVENGQYHGMTNDYLHLIGQKLGVTFELNNEKNWVDCYEKTLLKQNDILPVIQVTPQRQQQLVFSQPYIFLKTAIVTRRNRLVNQELTIEDLYGKRVAVPKGFFWLEILPTEHPEIQIIEVNNMVDGLVAVSFGQADALFATNATATHYINKNDITNLLISGMTPYQTQYSMGVRPDWQELPAILNAAIDAISLEEHQNIKTKWIKLDYYVPWYNKKLVGYVILCASGIFLLALVWAFSLKRQVNLKTQALKRINDELEKKVIQRTYELEHSNRKLRELSEKDGVTQIANRRFLDEELTKLFSDGKPKHPFITAFMVDVDFFKSYNDIYGHLKGDEALYSLAQRLKSLVKREGDIVARFGGEEFTLVFPGMNKAAAVRFAKNILAEIAKLNIEHTGSAVAQHLTVSIGISMVTDTNTCTPQQLLQQADLALYQAKTQGRNTFKLFEQAD